MKQIIVRTSNGKITYSQDSGLDANTFNAINITEDVAFVQDDASCDTFPLQIPQDYLHYVEYRLSGFVCTKQQYRDLMHIFNTRSVIVFMIHSSPVRSVSTYDNLETFGAQLSQMQLHNYMMQAALTQTKSALGRMLRNMPPLRVSVYDAYIAYIEAEMHVQSSNQAVASGDSALRISTNIEHATIYQVMDSMKMQLDTFLHTLHTTIISAAPHRGD